ncbi:MAG: DUF1735 domain-containing protein [Rikenellaceae bacterium]|nr:DUF1735 domain-containing protein [Rikenellaceae bacterium]
MLKYIYKALTPRYSIVVLLAAALALSCEDTITFEVNGDDHYQGTEEAYGFLRNVSTSRTSTAFDLGNDSPVFIPIYFGLTKEVDENVTVSLTADASLVELYNTENFTEYQAFPTTLVTVPSTLTVQKLHKNSMTVEIEIAPDPTLETGTYLFGVRATTSSQEITLEEESRTLYYFVRVIGDIPTNDKPGGIKTLCYVEVNGNNILNVGQYVLEDTGEQFFDHAVIFAANPRLDPETGRAYLWMNPNVRNVVDNPEIYVRPLQRKGIKVLMGLLGGDDVAGLASLKDDALRDYARQICDIVEHYGLDGVDFDDEYAGYVHPEYPGSGTQMARLAIEVRRLMPDKVLTLYEIGAGTNMPSTVDGHVMADVFDYSQQVYYGSWRDNSYIGMPRARYSPTAIWVNSTAVSTYRNHAQRIVDGGYGFFFMYDLNAVDATDYISEGSEIMFGQKVKLSGELYGKDW